LQDVVILTGLQVRERSRRAAPLVSSALLTTKLRAKG